MTRRYQMVVPSGVRIAASIASRNCSAPPARKASRPINSALTPAAMPLADRLQAAALLDHLHVVVVVASSLRSMVTQMPARSLPTTRFISALRNQRIAVPHQAVAAQFLARHVERAGIVGDLVERVEDRPHARPAAAPGERLLDPLVVEAGDDHRLVHAVGLERVELPVEQGAAVEVDQALGPVVDQMAEPRALAGGKDDRFHVRARPCLANAAAIGH